MPRSNEEHWTSIGRQPSIRGRILRSMLNLANSLTRSSYLVSVPKDAWNEDGLITWNNTAFVGDEGFQRAYAAAIDRCGFDYQIHWRTHTVVWAARTTMKIAGDIVELGTGRGWMASAIVEALPWESMSKTLWLCDRFLPQAVDNFSGAVIGATLRRNYADSPESSREIWANTKRVRLVVGSLPDSLSGLERVSQISMLHVDLNAAVPEVSSLEKIWGRLSPGAIVVLDDYALKGHERQYTGIRDLGDRLGFNVLTLPTGQGLILREPTPAVVGRGLGD